MKSDKCDALLKSGFNRVGIRPRLASSGDSGVWKRALGVRENASGECVIKKAIRNRLSETGNSQGHFQTIRRNKEEVYRLSEWLGRVHSRPSRLFVHWDGCPACCDGQLLKRARETANHH